MCQLQTHPLTDEDSVPGWIFYFSLETAKLCILHKLSIVKCKKNLQLSQDTAAVRFRLSENLVQCISMTANFTEMLHVKNNYEPLMYSILCGRGRRRRCLVIHRFRIRASLITFVQFSCHVQRTSYNSFLG